MFNNILYLLLLATLLNAQNTVFKKELVILDENFSSNNWTVLSISENDTADSFKLSNIKYRSAPTSMAIVASYPYAQDEWIISPKLDFSQSGNIPLLTFYEDHDFWYQSKGTHEVLYALTEKPGADDFVSLEKWTLKDHAINGFYNGAVSITLDDLAGESTVYIAFRYVSAENQYDDNWYIDNVRISQNVLYDATIFSSTIKDGSPISVSAGTLFSLYPQNRGLEPVSFPVYVELRDHMQSLLWADTMVTDALESWGKDTLSYTLPVVDDSSWFSLLVYTGLENDQARNNDTLSISVNTYVKNRTSMVEVFLTSDNYFSEGPALIVDSVAGMSAIKMDYAVHFPIQGDMLSGNASRELAADLNISRTATMVVDREIFIHEPYTSFQEWTQALLPLANLILARDSKKTPVYITGSAVKNMVDSSFAIDIDVYQAANLPDMDFGIELWLIEDRRGYSWLRLDSLFNRGMDLLRAETFSSRNNNENLFNLTMNYYQKPDTGISYPIFDETSFIALITDSKGRILNTYLLADTLQSPIITGLDSKKLLPDDFQIVGNYPNPFNPETTIEFHLPSSGVVDLKIYSVAGQQVFSLTRDFPAGKNSWRWLPYNLSSGTYFVMLKNQSAIRFHKVLLLK